MKDLGFKIDRLVTLNRMMFWGLKKDLAMLAADMGLKVGEVIHFMETDGDEGPTGEAMDLEVTSAVGYPVKGDVVEGPAQQSVKYRIISERHKTVHDVKSWPPYFRAAVAGVKPFEVRVADRDYQAGDELVLHEYVPTLENVRELYPDGIPKVLGFEPITEDKAGRYTGKTCREKVLSVWNAEDVVGLGAAKGVFLIGVRKLGD